MKTAHGYASRSSKAPLSPFTFERRDLRANDVGIRSSIAAFATPDLHTARGEWDGTVYSEGTVFPCVPGHEIVGRVTAVGGGVNEVQDK